MEDVLLNIFSYIHPYYINKNISIVCKEYNSIYKNKLRLIQKIQTLRELGNLPHIYNADIITYIKIYSIWYPIAEIIVCCKDKGNLDICFRYNIRRALSLGYDNDIISNMIDKYNKKSNRFVDIHNLLYSYNVLNILNTELCVEGISSFYLMESIYHGNGYNIKENTVEVNIGSKTYSLDAKNIINECSRPIMLRNTFINVLLDNEGFRLGYEGSDMEVMKNINSEQLEYIIYGYLLREDKKEDIAKILFNECVRIGYGDILLDKIEMYIYYLQEESIIKCFYSVYKSDYVALMFGMLPFHIFSYVLPIISNIEENFYEKVCKKNISAFNKSKLVYNLLELLYIYMACKNEDIGKEIINVIKDCDIKLNK